MLNQIKNWLKDNFIFVVLLIISIISIYPYTKGFRISYGEGPYAVSPYLMSFFYTWQDKINLGYPFSNQTLFFLFRVIWKILEVFSFIAHPSVIFFMVCGYLISGMLLYFVMKSIFPSRNKLTYLPPVLIYIFNIYRVQGGLSDENILLFLSVPLFFFFYYKLLNEQKWRYVFCLTVLSLLTSTMGKNLGIFTQPYLLMIVYFIYYLFAERFKNIKKILILNVSLGFLLLTANLFWIWPQSELLKSYYVASNSGKDLWAPLSSGTFFDHFRFMGFWAFRDFYDGGAYFPYAHFFYEPFILFTTFSIVIISYAYLFFLKEKPHHKLKIFFVFASIIFYLLMSGSKGILGLFYKFLYDNISLFKMYREPYTKFTPIYIFTCSFGLLFSLYYLYRYLKKPLLQIIATIILSSFILINAFPLFTDSFKFKPITPRAKAIIAKIPDYWVEFNNYFKRFKINQWLTVFQNNGYGTNSNWEYGGNVVGNMAEYLTDANIQIIRNFSMDPSDAGRVFNNIFRNDYEINNLKAYLGLINSRYILQENEVEWRYGGNFVLPPSKSNAIIKSKGFFEVARFGKFTPDLLSKIPNIEPNEKTRLELYKELTNQPALVLYKMEDSYFVPLFYTPKNIIVSQTQIKDFSQVVSVDNYIIPSAVFLTRQNATVSAQDYFKKFTDKNNLVFNRPIIEYKKINPTKYRVIIHQAKTEFPLIFSSNFNSDWKMYVKSRSNPKVNFDISRYQIFPGNENDQASISDLNYFLKNNWISEFNQENPQFISKMYQQTIQNDNLFNGSIFDSWTMTAHNDQIHLTANGYANAWIINPPALCKQYQCFSNADGSYDIELLFEYYPQRIFLLLFFTSTLIFIGSSVAILFLLIQNLRKEKINNSTS